MSGISGILNFDRAPLDQRLLRSMADMMAYRGPDAQNVWCEGHVGFSHAMLRTTREAAFETQPCTVNGAVWITADARLDGRGDLIRELESLKKVQIGSPTDPELLLHAYDVWGHGCVEHIIGDFAFAIWDGLRQELFCARDHFGIKPFYYAYLSHCLVFSNTLDCVRKHPAVSHALNEVAIGDFLLFDVNQDLATTVFADVRRVPPASILSWKNNQLQARRYWDLPVDEPIRYKRKLDYVDQFVELLRAAVDDRCRTDRVSIYMSGGLDSTSVAATARRTCSLQAYTVVYDTLFPDQERKYATIAAGALGIPADFLAADNYPLFGGQGTPEQRRPEPVNTPLLGVVVEQLRRMAAHGRVAFDCEGPDNLLLYEWQPHIATLTARRQFGRLLADVGSHLVTHRRLPLWRSAVKRYRRKAASSRDHPVFPPWLSPAVVARLGLRDRWEHSWLAPVSSHPFRPKAAASLSLVEWCYRFENSDPGVTGFPVEVRSPFMDLRMVRYLLALPVLTWCLNKHIEREAMRGELPEEVRRRPKTPLAGDPVTEQIRRHPDFWMDQLPFVEPMHDYVDQAMLYSSYTRGHTSVWSSWINLRPIALNRWLRDEMMSSVGPGRIANEV